MVEMSHDWATFLNKKCEFACIYFDFSQAFDKVSHKLIIKKMRSIGIDSKTVDWISSYLSNRTFRVKVSDFMGPELECTSGVPQGSVTVIFDLCVGSSKIVTFKYIIQILC